MLDNLTRRLASIVSGLRSKGRLSESDVNEMLREVRVALLEADVNLSVAKDFITRVKEKAVGEDIFSSLTADQMVVKVVRDELTELLGGDSDSKFNFGPNPPAIVLLCGLQGSGKTTTAGKLALWLQKQGKKPLLAACDRQRPAAIKQLEVLAESIEVPIEVGSIGDTAIQVAEKALHRAKHFMNDVLIVDTAGRLSIDESLIDELKRVCNKLKPVETFLVLDSTTGQEAVNVANHFHESVSLTGVIFTKLDGDTRGGALLSVRAATGVPVRFTGVGESIDALEPFFAGRTAERILGFGDILGIIEKAELAFDPADAMGVESKMRTGHIDFNDMLSQFRTMRKMGPIKNILKMMPGIGAQLPEEALDKVNDKNINRIEAMIFSMTIHERSNPDIINGSRRKRIAVGSGTSVQEVNALIKQLYDMRRGMKQFSKMQSRMSRHMKKR